MNLIYIESITRAIGIFITVFFTVLWAKKSTLKYDEFFMIIPIVTAIIIAFYL